MLGNHTENFVREGIGATISYDPYPEDFGEFRDANIIVCNMKSEYKPFTIGMPYGVRVGPYIPEGELPLIFQTWGYGIEWGYSEKGKYTSSLGHMLNFLHYRRTDNTLEQTYLHGMTNA